MLTRTKFENEDALLLNLQAGDDEAFKCVIRRYCDNLLIAAYGWTEDTELAEKLVGTLFIRLQRDLYKDAILPLDKYLSREVKLECTRIYGFP